MAERLSRATLALYALPLLVPAALNTLTLLYLFKYATDVLLIAPAAMGAVFMVGRFWDAASDPLVGYLSDRTRTRWGRRRPWFAASVPLFVLCPTVVWAPPEALDGAALIVWVGAGMLALDTAFTAFLVPHGALGVELSLEHHERSRIFGYRQIALQLGFFVALAAMGILLGARDKRAAAFWVAAVAGGASALGIGLACLRLQERVGSQQRSVAPPLRALRDVLRNPHARIMLGVLLIEHLGLAALAVIAPFYVQYVLGDETLLPYLAGSYLVASLVAVPAAVALSRRIGKNRTWRFAMVLSGLAFAAMFFPGPGDELAVYALGALVGIGNGTGLVMAASIQADIVDCDEHATGERREGMYVAVWNFVRKAASGLMGFLAGVGLQLVGFAPNVEQTETVRLVIRGLLALLPALAFGLGLVLFRRFRLTEVEHRRIRAELEQRA